MAVTADSRMPIWGLALRDGWRRTRRRLRVGWLHRWRFAGTTPARVLACPPDLRAADPLIAQDIYHGRFPLGGRMVETHGSSPFSLSVPHPGWREELHGFGWLRHCRAARTELAYANARALVSDWIEGPGRHIGGDAWEPRIVAARLTAWLAHSSMLLQGAEPPFHRAFLRSLMVQVRYLRAVTPDLPAGSDRLQARIALAFSALSLPVSQRALLHATRHLAHELERQILPDGGHRGRNPGMLVDLLSDLLPLRHTYAAQGEAPPPALLHAIERMLPMLRFFRHADDTLARFNGVGSTPHERIAAIMRHDESRGAPLTHAAHSGYTRLAQARAVVIADCGAIPPLDLSFEAHAGCLSFEFSANGRSLVVNSGVDHRGAADFRPLARATAAHSTLVLDDTSSARFALPRAAKDTRAAPMIDGPRQVTVERHERDAQGFTASHDGYLNRFGFVHERALRLDRNGARLAGLDRLVAKGRAARNATHGVLRFHLHPDVELFRDEHGALVLVARGNEAWTFRCREHEPQVEESIFFAGVAGPRRTRQIAIHFEAGDNAEIGWSFVRIEGGNA